MKIEKFDELLSDYNSKLNEINKEDITYKISVQNAAIIFFKNVTKLNKDFIYVYFKNIVKENIEKNEIQKYALNHLILLTIRYTDNSELFARFFPEYFDDELIPKSNWLIVRWFNTIISWIFKPKPKLLNLIEARKLLNALRNIKARVSNDENNLQFDVNSEMENYNALSFVVEKLFENKPTPLIYKPINDEDLLISWNETLQNQDFLKRNFADHNNLTCEIDSLLKYLNCRIKLISNLDQKKLLLTEIILLKALVYDKQFFLFEEKINQIRKIIKDSLMHQDTFKISGILNLIEGIKLRLKLICETTNVPMENQLNFTSDFKELFSFTKDKLQFYFEHYRENLDKQNEKCFVNNADFYNILDRLEKNLYTNTNLFYHSLSEPFDKIAYFRLLFALAGLQQTVKDLKNCTEAIDSQLLQNDVIKLSQFISNHVSILQTELQKESYVFITNVFNEEVYDVVDEEEARNDDELDDFDSEWETDWEEDDDEFYGSDISDTQSLNIMQHSQDLEEENFSTNLVDQSDSGISDEEELNSNYTLSNCPHTSFFQKTAINSAPTTNSECIYQQISVH